MKIIKQGKPELQIKPSKPNTISCSECGCVFEADRESYRQCFTSYNTFIFSANCPCCKNNVSHEESL